MKKYLLIFLFLFLAVPAFAATFSDDDIKARDQHNKLQAVYDYTGTTSGIPIYVGYGARGLATSETGWRIYKYTDSASGPTARTSADGIWDNRASLSYA